MIGYERARVASSSSRRRTAQYTNPNTAKSERVRTR